MIKKCPACHKKKEMRSNQKYCNEKCKKLFENLQRSVPKTKKIKVDMKPTIHLLNNIQPKTKPKAQVKPTPKVVIPSSTIPIQPPIAPPQTTQTEAMFSGNIACPAYLNSTAAEYWMKIAPTVIKRGHLNVLSEDAFAEMCDLFSRLRDVNHAINETNRNLLQVIDQWDRKKGEMVYQVKESALSDLKRKYSKLLLDYQNRFYLTPLANRGNFGLDDGDEEVDPHDAFLGMGK